ncbi:MAG: S4 domain-containing protein YaaA [Terrisporobacter sp.]|uniref:S4 domain-containing protein YaaA n=1 Tax=Clostridium sp. TaxID=1506 RepID=UPI0030629BDF
MVEIKIETEFIKLDSFLKFSGATTLGSEAKFFIQNEEVKVNDEIEVRRGKKLYKNDKVEFQGEVYIVI